MTWVESVVFEYSPTAQCSLSILCASCSRFSHRPSATYSIPHFLLGLVVPAAFILYNGYFYRIHFCLPWASLDQRLMLACLSMCCLRDLECQALFFPILGLRVLGVSMVPSVDVPSSRSSASDLISIFWTMSLSRSYCLSTAELRSFSLLRRDKGALWWKIIERKYKNEIRKNKCMKMQLSRWTRARDLENP